MREGSFRARDELDEGFCFIKIVYRRGTGQSGQSTAVSLCAKFRQHLKNSSGLDSVRYIFFPFFVLFLCRVILVHFLNRPCHELGG